MKQTNLIKALAMGVSFMATTHAFAQKSVEIPQGDIKTSYYNYFSSKKGLTLQAKTQKKLEDEMKSAGIQHVEFKGMANPVFDFYSVGDRENVDEIAVYEASSVDQDGREVKSDILFGFKNSSNDKGITDNEFSFDELESLKVETVYKNSDHKYAHSTIAVNFFSPSEVENDKEHFEVIKDYKNKRIVSSGHVDLNYLSVDDKEGPELVAKIDHPLYPYNFDCTSEKGVLDIVGKYMSNFEAEYKEGIDFVEKSQNAPTKLPGFSMSNWKK
jgi:hypothetical protein